LIKEPIKSFTSTRDPKIISFFTASLKLDLPISFVRSRESGQPEKQQIPSSKGMKLSKKLRQLLTSASLVTQALGFTLMGAFMIFNHAPGGNSKFAGLLAIVTGAAFVTAAITNWRNRGCSSPPDPGNPGKFLDLNAGVIELPAASHQRHQFRIGFKNQILRSRY
jgi:hypothetical protein